MRILTRRWFDLCDRASGLGFPFMRSDPRASVFDPDLYDEVVLSLYGEALEHLSYEMRSDRTLALPTSDDVVSCAKTIAERRVSARIGGIPEEVRHLVADPRLFCLGVCSPEVRDVLDRIRVPLSDEADETYGRWAWHILEEVPGLGADAEMLAHALLEHRYECRTEGDTIHMGWKHSPYSIVLRGVRGPDPFPDSIYCRYLEMYREDGVWMIELADRDGDCLTIECDGFSVSKGASP